MKTQRKIIGDLGEGIACRYLKGQGFKVLEQNYLKKWGEIDIITQKGEFLHFVEVKTLQKNDVESVDLSNNDALQNVHEKKLQRLWRTIESYLSENNVYDDIDWQLDVCAVYLDVKRRKAKIELIENVMA